MSRSHFETQDTIELGQPVGGHRDYASGFLGRLAATLGSDAPIAFTDQLPLVFRGGPVIPNIALAGASGKPALDARQSKLIEAMYRGQRAGSVDLSPPKSRKASRCAILFSNRSKTKWRRPARPRSAPMASRFRPSASGG